MNIAEPGWGAQPDLEERKKPGWFYSPGEGKNLVPKDRPRPSTYDHLYTTPEIPPGFIKALDKLYKDDGEVRVRDAGFKLLAAKMNDTVESSFAEG
mmetsp:Transcript_29610/g.79992  ORF Transcript_29610/g.79992 Transcript_29610/m.79992 type:complete len:96 (-) Transcript_29610:78-365(-)|eukprot:CAMPEP_0171229624 /NCGR_PEP_ID=MMETSP0790-20130122/38978_1 /TAXON_ID=2925 /ORGANISM="Alexandrium catenella, Strain OF101" /LENGTH=95 /DNA_ID=CAMNT_0011695813 /DNA_START=84 /DNA_END=371 /DNA_ORIENTATION=+